VCCEQGYKPKNDHQTKANSMLRHILSGSMAAQRMPNFIYQVNAKSGARMMIEGRNVKDRFTTSR